MKQKYGFLQVGLVIGIASIVVAVFLINKLGVGISQAVVQGPYWDGKTELTGPEMYEGCLTERRGKDGVLYIIRRQCGRHRNNQQQPTPTPTVTPTPTPSSTPTPTPTGTPISTPTSTPESTPTPTPVPSGTPNFCGGTCGSNYNCQGGLFCSQGFCRNPDCPGEASCGCRISTPTPPPVLGASTPPQLPKTGVDDFGILAGLLGIGVSGILIFRRFKLI